MTLMQIIARVTTMREENEEYKWNKTIVLSESVFIALIREVHPNIDIPPKATAEWMENNRVYTINRASKSDLDVEQVMIKLIKEIQV